MIEKTSWGHEVQRGRSGGITSCMGCAGTGRGAVDTLGGQALKNGGGDGNGGEGETQWVRSTAKPLQSLGYGVGVGKEDNAWLSNRYAWKRIEEKTNTRENRG